MEKENQKVILWGALTSTTVLVAREASLVDDHLLQYALDDYRIVYPYFRFTGMCLFLTTIWALALKNAWQNILGFAGVLFNVLAAFCGACLCISLASQTPPYGQGRLDEWALAYTLATATMALVCFFCIKKQNWKHYEATLYVLESQSEKPLSSKTNPS